MFCQKCGTQNPDDASFCNKCGNNLNSIKPERKGITGKLGKIGIPGFRSGKSWKMGLAFIGYFFIFMIFLAIISPNNSETNVTGGNNTDTIRSKVLTIPYTRKELVTKLDECGTKLQCDDFVTTYINGNRINWTGKVLDVNDNVYVATENCNSACVILTGIDKLDRLKIKKYQIINFTGTIYLDKSMTDGNLHYAGGTAWSYALIHDALTISDAKILNN